MNLQYPIYLRGKYDPWHSTSTTLQTAFTKTYSKLDFNPLPPLTLLKYIINNEKPKEKV